MPNWKPLPVAVDRRQERRQLDAKDERARTRVRQEDQYRCRLCGRPTRVVHEQERRGAGGTVSLENSYLACDVFEGGLCHVLLQRYLITARMGNGSEVFDAREDLVFEMPEKIARLVFETRPRPPHVRIVET
jgi:hypothetical protein